MTNILITCSGRRTSLLRGFMDAAHRRGGSVWAGDVSNLAPTVHLADQAVLLPRIDDEDYICQLLDIVDRFKISLLVPTIDTELSLLAHHADEFRALGCEPLVSSPDFVAISGDKWTFFEAMSKRSIETPKSWLPDDMNPSEMPAELFLKPRKGSSSQGIRALHKSDLAQGFATDEDPIIQERISAPEVTLDALLGLDGTPLHCVPRRRLRTLGGESIQGVTLPFAEFEEWIAPILHSCQQLGARGPITLQAFLTESGPLLFEINPRFGGGYPLTAAAGGNYAELCVQMLERTPLPAMFGQYREGLYMTRFSEEIFTTTLPW